MKWLIFLLALHLFVANFSYAQDIRRCVQSDGTVTYTDKSCADGEVEKQKTQPYSSIQKNTKKIFTAPPMCIKNTAELLYSVRIAIEAHDANQLAKNYHWSNVSNQQANNVFNRLESIVSKPLIDIRLLQSNSQISTDQIPNTESNEDSQNTIKPSNNSYALKIVQYNKSATSQQLSTIFKLQQHYGCYWIQF